MEWIIVNKKGKLMFTDTFVSQEAADLAIVDTIQHTKDKKKALKYYRECRSAKFYKEKPLSLDEIFLGKKTVKKLKSDGKYLGKG